MGVTVNLAKTLAVLCAFVFFEGRCHAAILNAKPPEQGLQIAYGHLKKSASDFLEMPLKELRLADPRRSYLIGADEIANGQLLSGARQFSWQYLVLQREKPVAEIHLNANERAGPLLKVMRVSRGPLVDAFSEASEQAAELPQVKVANYELRLLNAPSVHFYAIWLHRASDDILIPLNPSGLLPKELVRNRAYSEPEVLKVLTPIAEETIRTFRKAAPNAVG